MKTIKGLQKEIKQFFKWIATSVYNMGLVMQPTEVRLHCLELVINLLSVYSVNLLELEIAVTLVLYPELWPQLKAVRRFL